MYRYSGTMPERPVEMRGRAIVLAGAEMIEKLIVAIMGIPFIAAGLTIIKISGGADWGLIGLFIFLIGVSLVLQLQSLVQENPT